MEIHTEEYRGFHINIHYDEDACNPREIFDQLGKMVFLSQLNYGLGDKQVDDFDEHLRDMAVEAVPGLDNMLDYFLDDEDTDDELVGMIVEPTVAKHYIALPLYFHEHSGISISTSGSACNWDSGQEGLIYVSRKQAIAEYGKEDYEEKAIKLLRAEVEEYDHYIAGRVYGYVIEPKDTNKGIDCDDSCWGFYGDYDDAYMLDQAKSAINHAIERYRQEVIKTKRERKLTERFLRTHWAD